MRSGLAELANAAADDGRRRECGQHDEQQQRAGHDHRPARLRRRQDQHGCHEGDQRRARGAGHHSGNEEDRHAEVAPATLAHRRRGHDHRCDRGDHEKRPHIVGIAHQADGSVVPFGSGDRLPDAQLLQNGHHRIGAAADHQHVDRFPLTRLRRDAGGEEDHRGGDDRDQAVDAQRAIGGGGRDDRRPEDDGGGEQEFGTPSPDRRPRRPPAQNEQSQQHDRLGAKDELLRQPKRVRTVTHHRERKNDEAEGYDDQDGALDHGLGQSSLTPSVPWWSRIALPMTSSARALPSSAFGTFSPRPRGEG